jgi:hypothetical protein
MLHQMTGRQDVGRGLSSLAFIVGKPRVIYRADLPFYRFGALFLLESNQVRQRYLPNGRGSCGLFGPQQRENERWVNCKGKWLSLLEVR